jgi:hypothetical protein
MFQGALRGQKAACLAGKYVSRSLAVHAGFEKFCIPRGNRRKREFRHARGVIRSNGAPAEPCRTTQNAGCMMAIHANCTNPKFFIFYKLMIYKDFLKNH